MIEGVIIPAAGLGTRLRPLTDSTPKELLPIGGRPAIAAALEEARNAGVDRIVVVTAPHKPQLTSWLKTNHPEVHIAEQPSPAGVIDAVERGRALLRGPPYAVLYPDYLHLPRHDGLRQVCAAHAQCEGTLFGLLRVTPSRAHILGRTVKALPAPGSGPLRRLTGIVSTKQLEIGALHTTFAEIRSSEYQEALDAELDGSAPADSVLTKVLNRIAAAGHLYGFELDGEVLDLGVRSGYEDAVRRLAGGERGGDR